MPNHVDIILWSCAFASLFLLFAIGVFIVTGILDVIDNARFNRNQRRRHARH